MIYTKSTEDTVLIITMYTYTDQTARCVACSKPSLHSSWGHQEYIGSWINRRLEQASPSMVNDGYCMVNIWLIYQWPWLRNRLIGGTYHIYKKAYVREYPHKIFPLINDSVLKSLMEMKPSMSTVIPNQLLSSLLRQHAIQVLLPGLPSLHWNYHSFLMLSMKPSNFEGSSLLSQSL